MGAFRQLCGGDAEVLIECHVLGAEAAEDYVGGFGVGACVLGAPGADGFYCDLGGSWFGEAVDAGGYGGEGDGVAGVFGGEVEAVLVAAGEEGGFVVVAVVPDGAYGVEDPFCGEVEAGGGFGLAGFATSEEAASGEELGACGSVDGSVYASTAEEGGVGGVDYCVDVEGGDVGLDGGEGDHWCCQTTWCVTVCSSQRERWVCPIRR
jgi:hypothetical protein